MSANALLVARTRLPFIALCLFVASQAYTIPIVAIGPSWATWPTLSDVALVFVAATWLVRIPPLGPKINYTLAPPLLVILGGVAVWYVIPVLYGLADPQQLTDGIYDVARLATFVVGFFAIIRIPLTQARLTLLYWLSAATLLVACASIGLTYSGLVPTSALAPLLPRALEQAGPWYAYLIGNETGQGVVGFNHGYTAMQILALLALHLHTAARIRRRPNALLAAAVIAATVFSGSRDGLAVILLFSLVVFIRRPGHLALIGLVMAVGAWLAVSLASNGPLNIATIIDRQSALLHLANADSYAGRVAIWQDKLAYLGADVQHWLVGSGVGSGGVASVSGSRTNAHLLLLHILTETGILGTLVFVWWARKTLRFLNEVEPFERPVLWLTVALLVASATAETLYPVPANQGFLGLYLAILAIASGSGRTPSPGLVRDQDTDPQGGRQTFVRVHDIRLG